VFEDYGRPDSFCASSALQPNVYRSHLLTVLELFAQSGPLNARLASGGDLEHVRLGQKRSMHLAPTGLLVRGVKF
jgi:hypothetical protein